MKSFLQDGKYYVSRGCSWHMKGKLIKVPKGDILVYLGGPDENKQLTFIHPTYGILYSLQMHDSDWIRYLERTEVSDET